MSGGLARGSTHPTLRSFFFGCLLCCVLPSVAWAKTVIVGAKNFTEQYIIAELTRQLLESHGFSVRTKTGLSSMGVRREQETGLIDLYWEYTGTSLRIHNRVAGQFSPDETYARVKAADARKGLVWLRPSRINNTYALAMRRPDAQAKGLATISDLAVLIRSGGAIRFACNTEFFTRSDGLLPLQRAYAFEFGQGDVVRTSDDAIYEGLRSKAWIDVGLVFSTDGRVAAFDLLLLRDDRNFFPSYRLAPVVRQTVLESHLGLAAVLEALAARLDDPTMAHLNALVDVGGITAEEAARRFLMNEGLSP